MNFDKLPIWQKEAILIAEVLSGSYGHKPISKYAPKVEAKISKLVVSIGSIETMKKDVSILKKVLPEITKLTVSTFNVTISVYEGRPNRFERE